jgi:lipopolysaccharide/colanic/teichoic acid biosynthesis glycosyltransferase
MPVWKRAGDVFCALLALPVLAAGTVAMTVVTRIGSPGPVFFRQWRVGRDGRLFPMYKFRTMRPNADTTVHQDHFKQLMASQAPMTKLDGRRDCRLIPGGGLLRASGLDELPQFINVLWGEMSLVGPRPCLPGEFGQMTPAQRERVNVAPGLTGLWQVSGKNRTTFDEMIGFDLRYARRISLLGDFRIVCRTPLVLSRLVIDSLRRRRFDPRVPTPRPEVQKWRRKVSEAEIGGRT